ncbi:acyl-CoA dehydrogenase family protein [Streptomyces sp. bgisy027]|uniref:acyl-CoA dehydrogenase family protein n=1 Tax=Streptomyces sp. bgisy027 TaxID=3413770 RepID=UPI003D74BC7E
MTSTVSEDELRLLAATCAEIFDAHEDGRPPAGAWDPELWKTLEESGLTLVSVSEKAGGSGGTLHEAAAVIGAAGEHAVCAPLGETALLGAWLLAEAGLPLPAGPLTAADGTGALTARRSGDRWELRGRLSRVAWGRQAAGLAVAVLSEDGEEAVALLNPQDFVFRPGLNSAGEPRDDLSVDTRPEPDHVAAVPSGTADQLRLRQALLRTVLIAGAAERALVLTLRYTAEREQFGRALGSFQAVQQQVAELAAEAAAIRVAADAAVALCEAVGVANERAGFAVAAAKVQAGRGAGLVARIAHQVHGAIGFTDEHPLRLATTRLWAWRDEAGDEAQWATGIGGRALAAGTPGIWELITEAD